MYAEHCLTVPIHTKATIEPDKVPHSEQAGNSKRHSEIGITLGDTAQQWLVCGNISIASNATVLSTESM